MSVDARPVVPSRGRLRPLTLDEVEITGGTWARRQAVNAANTLAHCHDWMERLEWIDNFRRAAAGTIAGNHHGMVFADSDVYKLIEALAWEVGRSGSTDADDRIRGLTDVIGATQEPDGYLDTVFGRQGQPPRYSDLEWGHELYNVGHLLQAAVAPGAHLRRRSLRRDRARHGRPRLRSVRTRRHRARRRPPRDRARAGRVGTHDRRAALPRPSGDVHRSPPGAGRSARSGSGRATSRTTCRSTSHRAHGHAVRALYLAHGARRRRRRDRRRRAAGIGGWEATIARRTYLTGGIGSLHAGEAFGDARAAHRTPTPRPAQASPR